MFKYDDSKSAKYDDARMVVNAEYDADSMRYVAARDAGSSTLNPAHVCYNSPMGFARSKYDYESGGYFGEQVFSSEIVVGVSGASWKVGEVNIIRNEKSDELNVDMKLNYSDYGVNWVQKFGSGRMNPKSSFKEGVDEWLQNIAAPMMKAMVEKEAESAFAKFDELVASEGKSDAKRIEELEAKLEEANAQVEAVKQESSIDVLMKNAMIATLEPVMKAKAEEMAAEFEEKGMIPHVLEVHCAEKANQVKGVVHERMPYILTLVENDVPVYLHGPAGTGKNFLAEQVAQATGREFEYMGKVDDKFTDCVGYGDANGNTHDTPLTRAVKDGKLLFIDEIDASIPEVLVTVNALLANGYMVTGWGEFLEADENFRVIVAGNTMGTGADRTYNGRYTLDGATLDRFAMVELDYDERIEKAMAGDDENLVKFAHWMREALKENGNIAHTVSYRAIKHVRVLTEAGCDLQEVMRSCVIKQLDKDDVRILTSWIRNNHYDANDNKYFAAMSGIAGM